MLWDILEKENYILYINRVIDLKVKVVEAKIKDKIYMNYKGFNLTTPMLVWEFGEDLSLASIEGVRIGGRRESDEYFIVDKKYREQFLEEMYFFLVDNNMDCVMREIYRVNWK